MNHLINVVRFHKLKNKNSLDAINDFFTNIDEEYYIKPTRSIKTPQFNFIFFAKQNKKTNGCPLCFENIYINKYLKIMPLCLNNRFYFIQPSIKQYVKNHIVIIDFVHYDMKISEDIILTFYDFIKQFPHLVICSNTDLENIGGSINKHQHFQAGIMDMPLFHQDATLIEEDIYLVDWYLTTFLIRDAVSASS